MNISIDMDLQPVPVEKTENFDSEVQFNLSNIFTIKQYIKRIWNLGFITYGGPMAHIGIFHNKLVTQMKCISDAQFTQLMTICQSLPGPTSTQLLTAVSMYATGSFWGGLAAFLIFSLPTFVIMFICGISISSIMEIKSIQFLLPGLRVVAIAVILQAFYGLFKKIASQYIMALVVFVSAGIYLMLPSSVTIVILFVVAGIIGYFFSNIAISANQSIIAKRFQSSCYGLKNLVFFCIILLLVIIFLPMTENIFGIIFGVFYKIGALVIGGGHVILPLMYTSFQPYDLISQEDFANGFSIISVLPGPMFNLSVYIGTFISQSIGGGLAAFLGLYIPCFLFVMAIVPYWQAYRSQLSLRKIISGVCSSSIGLILTAAIMLWLKQCLKYEGIVWPILSTSIIVISFVLLQNNVSIPIVFVIGDFLYFVMATLWNK